MARTIAEVRARYGYTPPEPQLPTPSVDFEKEEEPSSAENVRIGARTIQQVRERYGYTPSVGVEKAEENSIAEI